VRKGAAAAIAIGLTLALVAGCNSGNERQATDARVRVVSQNLLHGIACPPATDRCRLSERVELFATQLSEAGCPEIVAVQEANAETVEALRGALPEVCGDRYEIVWDDDPGVDRELVLTTDRVLGSERIRLAGPLRSALWVRVAAEVGPVDLVTTHLASSSDDRPCDAAICPPPCETADTVNTCQARQAADLLDAHTGPRSVGVLAGDLNAKPGEPTLEVLHDRGYLDTHRMAGNAACDPETGAQCTSGRVDDALTDMTDPASRQVERIDYVLVHTRRDCRAARPTGVFAPEGGPRTADGLVFPADHSGVQATLRCETTAADRSATSETTRTTSTTTSDGAAVAPETQAAVTAAFDTLFGGAVTDPAAKLAALEDADLLRDSFIQRMTEVAALAARTSVRIDTMTAAGPDAVDVTFSILLDDAVVLDALAGRAVNVDGRWLVSRATYCQVATLGVDEIPEACRT